MEEGELAARAARRWTSLVRRLPTGPALAVLRTAAHRDRAHPVVIQIVLLDNKRWLNINVAELTASADHDGRLHSS
jgi:hypothetical protein